ncbi:hypothetical protein LR48_Vigan01g258600 [Vigna angularis]|uniref:Uncharacterized protein n=1 Tax=Phaseolus angularis TaxID=3914 RepID=A0A0L9TR66_PHAAN|nr:hypothetical protein LR48_Vigan01g258600 [Vigna angularis]
MCSMISAQGVAVATAMAVSGTVILLALRLQKSFPPPQFALHQIPPSSPPVLRSCISNGGSHLPLFLHANTFANTRPKTCLFVFALVCFADTVVVGLWVSCAAGKKSKKKKMKRVHFAEDVVESCRDGQEFRNRISRSKKVQKSFSEEMKNGEMPTNRVALYNGILRDRVAQRLAYSC